MSYQAEELKYENPSSAVELKHVKLSVSLAVQALKSCFEYVQRWTEEDGSGPI